MKIKIDTEIKPLYIIIIIGVIAFIFLSVFQFNRNRNINQELKEKKEEVSFLQSTNEQLNNNVLKMERERSETDIQINSLINERTYYKNKYYATDKKLKNILDSFDSLSIEDRWNALTKSLNN